jgi:hypothetical protein
MDQPEGLAERRRNQLLRRVDWRFLLRLECRPATVSFAGRRLTAALELVSATASRARRQAEAADLTVVVWPHAGALAKAFAALRPGGEIYAEWYLPMGLARLRRRLEAAGFVNVRCYLSWPWPQRSPRFWLPVDDPAAVAAFLASRPHSALLLPAWRVAVRLGLMIPVCTIAQKPGDAAGTPEELLPSDLSWVLLTGGRRSVNKVVGLGFADSETRPRLAVKFARNASEDDPLEREAATLRTLGETAPQLAGRPQLLFVGRRAGRVAVGETAVSGHPVLHWLDHTSLPEVAGQVTSWLVDLAGDVEAEPRATWWERLVESPAREFERMFVSLLASEETVRAREILSTLSDLPLVCEHRDCSPWNVLHDDGGELAVVDWESSEPRGLPALDLVYFLTYAALFVEGTVDGGGAETYARTLDPHSTVGRVVQACERSYCVRLGLDPEQLRPLRLLCWMVHAQSEYRLLEQDTAGPPGRKALATSLFLSFWRQELGRGGALTPSHGLGA